MHPTQGERKQRGEVAAAKREAIEEFKHHQKLTHVEHGGWLHQGRGAGGLSEFFGALHKVMPTQSSIFNPISGWGGVAGRFFMT